MHIIQDIESFASVIEKDIKKIWSKAPSLATIAITTLTFAGPVLETVITIEAGAAVGTAVTNAINKAETDLVAAKSLVTAIGPTLSVQNLIGGVSSDLQDLLTLGAIKNATAIANVKLVVSELAALDAAFTTANVAAAGPVTASAPLEKAA